MLITLDAESARILAGLKTNTVIAEEKDAKPHLELTPGEWNALFTTLAAAGVLASQVQYSPDYINVVLREKAKDGD